jgi:hypothetical protein
MRVRLFRLESHDGLGVFSSDAAIDARERVARKRGVAHFSETGEPSPTRHPTPTDDVPGWYGHPDQYSYYCAFGSIPCMLRWFDSEAIRVEFNALGVELVEFECDEADILKGEFQWMFRKDRAAIVDRHPVPTVS